MRRDDEAGAETVGAILLFGLFVTVVAVLNLTAVPQAGLEKEEDHHDAVLSSLNALQSAAEGAALPGGEGATVAGSLPLSPARHVAQDFMSHFLATPARASGELSFVRDHGNVTLFHHVDGATEPVVDAGSLVEPFPTGRITFDPHPVYRSPGTVDVELGAVALSADSSLLHPPVVDVAVSDSVTSVTVKVRLLNGTDANVGGSADVRIGLRTESATSTNPAAANARNATLRIETAHGSAWGAFLNATATKGGLVHTDVDEAASTGFTTVVLRGAGDRGLDVVRWTVHGVGVGNDVRLASGLSVHHVTFT